MLSQVYNGPIPSGFEYYFEKAGIIMIVEVIIKDAPFSLNFSIFFDFFATSTRKINEMILPHVFFSP